MKIEVDQNKCIGCGNCVALTQNSVFDFNDDGLAECIVEEISEDKKEVVEEAINECPTEAIKEKE